jgi:glucose/arabinose dehydrogenase
MRTPNESFSRRFQGAVLARSTALAAAFLAFASLTPAAGFRIERIATVTGARELAFAPGGDLFVGTVGNRIYLIPNAESNSVSPQPYAQLGDDPDAGVAFAGGTLYAGTQHAVWRIQYKAGSRHPAAAPTIAAHVRSGAAPAGSDGDVHTTTSVAADAAHLYASVGSSCNACVENDPTRATVGEVRDGHYNVIARRIRNAVALAIDPQSRHLWASDAGQDELPPGHPFEFFDDVSAHRAPVDYGWPFCYENGKHKPGTHESCGAVALPKVVLPAYATPLGAAFYPVNQRGRYVFPAQFRGGVFITLHGSWHGPAQGLAGYIPPRVVYVAMRAGNPVTEADWSDASLQWHEFVGGYQQGAGNERSGRPTGIAVGPQGDLFVADDLTGAIYRIRPR